MRLKTGRRSWNECQKRAAKQLHARECGVGVQSTLSVRSSEQLDPEREVGEDSNLLFSNSIRKKSVR